MNLIRFFGRAPARAQAAKGQLSATTAPPTSAVEITPQTAGADCLSTAGVTAALPGGSLNKTAAGAAVQGAAAMWRTGNTVLPRPPAVPRVAGRMTCGAVESLEMGLHGKAGAAAASGGMATFGRVATVSSTRTAFAPASCGAGGKWLLRRCRSSASGGCCVSQATAQSPFSQHATAQDANGSFLLKSSSCYCRAFDGWALQQRFSSSLLTPKKQHQYHLHQFSRSRQQCSHGNEGVPLPSCVFPNLLLKRSRDSPFCPASMPRLCSSQPLVHQQPLLRRHETQHHQQSILNVMEHLSLQALPLSRQKPQQPSLAGGGSLGAAPPKRFLTCCSSSSSSTGKDSGSSAAASAASLAAEPFLTGTSAAYVEQMYAAWRRDPASVHTSWAAYFANVQRGLSPTQCFSLPPADAGTAPATAATRAGGNTATKTEGFWCPYVASAPGSLPAGSSFVSPDVVGGGSSASPQSVQDTSRLIQMVRGYQLRGHECAAVNPLELPRTLPFVSVPHSRSAAAAAKLDYTTYGFTETDLNRVFDCRVPGMEGFLSAERAPLTLGQLVRRLQEAYCGSIGVEYMHINDREVCNFIRKHIETPEKYTFPTAVQQKILARTARAQLFENFCGQRFSTSKRFGLDGCETMIVGLKALTKKAAREGVKSVVIGMPHRGRLNVLVNILHKPMQQLLSEFLGVTKYSLAEWGNSGDVKYHLGVEFDHFDADAQRYIHMGVLPNPSHLEAVDPLVVGQARAQQYYSGDRDCSTVLPILLHGDASIAGQGVVYETLQMSQLPFYRVGGAIHIVVNNQIGFTTNPVDSCSGRYCTDVAKAFDAPVFHVNADDPEAVTFVSELAFKYRQHFKGDVFIDLIGYRRLGHNELDMPKFTQPAMYTVISQKKPVFDLYADKLREQGVVQETDLQRLKESISTFYNSEYEKCKTYLPTQNYEYSPQWKHLVRPDIAAAPRLTGVPVDRLRELGACLYTLPPGLNVHPTVGKIFKERLNAIQSNVDEKVIDFGTAETLCYATLLSDGFHEGYLQTHILERVPRLPEYRMSVAGYVFALVKKKCSRMRNVLDLQVRLSGQDVQRGTFSHRHAVLHDQTTFEPYCIYHSLRGYNFPHEILFANSLLSEYAAMGYEFGYSLEHPDSLCVWEAQFGDFSNGAQIIIDQFVASGEVKWNRQSGIVLMLPHGYDGQGPEHSSGRIERLLQLCDDREDVIHKENWEIERSSVIQQHNLQVIMPSTPANMFHALRRQVHREFRKPLVIFSPKRMLKMRAAMCALRQLDEGTRFRRYIPDKVAVPEKVRRLIVCSGQVYYDIIAAREKRRASAGEAEGPGDQIAVARMEQLSPFPFDLFIKDLQQYPNLQTVVWAQEEPMNQGAWFYTSKRIENSLSHLGFPNGIRAPVYAGRDVNATTAVGDKRLHDQEVTQLLEDALDLNRMTHSYLEKYIHKQKEKGEKGTKKGDEEDGEVK